MVRIFVQTALLAIFILGGALPVAAEEAAKPSPEEFSGYIMTLGNAMSGAQNIRFRLSIKEYTSNADTNELAAILKEKGSEGLEKALRKVEKGYIQVGGRLGYPISVARSLQGPQGRIIRVVTDRPIPFVEAMNGLRSLDYAFGVAEFKLDAQGQGEGTIIAAAKLKFNNEGQLEVESFGTQPMKLRKVKLETKKK